MVNTLFSNLKEDEKQKTIIQGVSFLTYTIANFDKSNFDRRVSIPGKKNL